ncbi:Hypothetical protein R9X50_00099300 [Acrodontium crateriforme]|uniref:MoaB/Mog domain-containing protein n=1 Tax=Acrodontium crateriforme TaxID=150365 RepID=A0AAQ3LZ84_9PEZI|nr:Hypothetical protein R9X50_00099300 [Acrodontium crateriforme]
MRLLSTFLTLVGFIGDRKSFTMAAQPMNHSDAIRTAACLVIGDEILGGKTVDTNSNVFAKWCFSLGIVSIPSHEDDEVAIIDAVRRLSSKFDMVVTSGGIGPTHDDITYQSIAKAFDLELELYQEAFEQMKRMTKPNTETSQGFSWEEASDELQAKLRVVTLPFDRTKPKASQCLLVSDVYWVPISVVNQNVFILPGIPRIFQDLLSGLKPLIRGRCPSDGSQSHYRIVIETPLPESKVANFLSTLSARVEPQGIKVGSYPCLGGTNTVTLVGNNLTLLESLVAEVEHNTEGKRLD